MVKHNLNIVKRLIILKIIEYKFEMNFRRKNQNGFSMVEVLASLVIIGVGMLGLSGLQIASMKGANNAHSRTTASMLIAEIADRMRANPLGVEGNFYENNVNCVQSERFCRGNRFCNPEQTARFDVQEVMCGYKRTTTSSREGGVRNLLFGGSLTIEQTECNAANNNNDEYEIEISWKKSQISDKQDNDSTNQSLLICLIP